MPQDLNNVSREWMGRLKTFISGEFNQLSLDKIKQVAMKGPESVSGLLQSIHNRIDGLLDTAIKAIDNIKISDYTMGDDKQKQAIEIIISRGKEYIEKVGNKEKEVLKRSNTNQTPTTTTNDNQPIEDKKIKQEEGMFDGIFNSARTLMNNVLQTLKSIWNFVSNIISTIFKMLKAIWDKLKEFFNKIFSNQNTKTTQPSNAPSTTNVQSAAKPATTPATKYVSEQNTLDINPKNIRNNFLRLLGKIIVKMGFDLIWLAIYNAALVWSMKQAGIKVPQYIAGNKNMVLLEADENSGVISFIINIFKHALGGFFQKTIGNLVFLAENPGVWGFVNVILSLFYIRYYIGFIFDVYYFLKVIFMKGTMRYGEKSKGNTQQAT